METEERSSSEEEARVAELEAFGYRHAADLESNSAEARGLIERMRELPTKAEEGAAAARRIQDWLYSFDPNDLHPELRTQVELAREEAIGFVDRMSTIAAIAKREIAAEESHLSSIGEETADGANWQNDNNQTQDNNDKRAA